MSNKPIVKGKTLKPGDAGYWEWMATQGAKSIGRPKKIPNAKMLWKYACDYFKSVDERPFMKNEILKGGERAGEIVQVPTIRPYSWSGFSAYLMQHKIVYKIKDYKENRDGSYTEFQPVIRMIGEVMYSQKFEGAAVNAFNASVITRELQMPEFVESTEKKEVVDMTPEERKARMADLMRQAKEQAEN